MSKTINWGIIGLGAIAKKFAADLVLSNDSRLYAVASRDLDKAQEFGAAFNAVKYYGAYEDLAEDPNIDIIYIATPNSFHFENTMMCLKKGKAVLCEKPMGLNTEEVQIMICEAQSRKLFLMEGIWTRFIPATEKLMELLEQKTIGALVSVKADFKFKGNFDPENRLYNKKLGGGSLLDVGIYPIYLSHLLLGLPAKTKASAQISTTEVDSSCTMRFEYKNGATANLESSIETQAPIEATIYGDKGSIHLHHCFHHTEKLTVSLDGKKEDLDIKYKGFGYIYEIKEAENCLLNHKTESAKLPLKTSLDLIAVIDKVKKEIEAF